MTSLLKEFRARDLHVAEWEVVVNAIGTGNVDVVRPFLVVDPDIVRWTDKRIGGSVFGVILQLIDDWDRQKVMSEFMVQNGADLNMRWGENMTILDEAMPASNADMIRWLADNGVEVAASILDEFDQKGY